MKVLAIEGAALFLFQNESTSTLILKLAFLESTELLSLIFKLIN